MTEPTKPKRNFNIHTAGEAREYAFEYPVDELRFFVSKPLYDELCSESEISYSGGRFVLYGVEVRVREEGPRVAEPPIGWPVYLQGDDIRRASLLGNGDVAAGVKLALLRQMAEGCQEGAQAKRLDALAQQLADMAEQLRVMRKQTDG